MLPDFELSVPGPWTATFTNLGIHHFNAACQYIHDLPYGRNTSRADFSAVLAEKKGTCSSKHGLLARIAEAQGQEEIHLMAGIFLMSEKTHPVLGTILQENGLTVIPEAHAYLRFRENRYDFTFPGTNISAIEPFIVREQRCEPQQLVEWKPMIHRHYLESWLKRQKISLSLEEVWQIRERCIELLARL